MEKPFTPTRSMSRRVFLCITGGVGVAILTACGQSSAPANPPTGATSAPAAAPTSASSSASQPTVASAAAPTATTAAQPTTAPVTQAAASAPTNAPVNLRFANWDVGPLGPKLFGDTFARYTAKHPNVKVQTDFTTYSEFYPKMITEAAAGTADDILNIDGVWFPSLAEKAVPGNVDDNMKDVNQQDFFPLWKEYCFYKGHWYGFNYAVTSELPILNLDLFKAANVPVPDTTTWTWDDFVQIATKLTLDKSGKNPTESGFDPKHIVQFGQQYGPGDATSIQMGLSTSGNKLFDGGRYETKTKTFLGTPDFFDPAQAMNDMVYKFHIGPTPEDATATQGDTFQTKRIAIGRIWNDGLSQNLADPKYYTFPIQTAMYPKWKGKQVGIADSAVICLYGKGKNREAAWPVLLWMGTSPEFVVQSNDVTGAPFTYSNQKVAEQQWKPDFYSLMKPYIESIQKGYPRPYGSESFELHNAVLSPLWKSTMASQMDVSGPYKQAAQKANAILKKYYT